MDYYSKDVSLVLKTLKTDKNYGLTVSGVEKSRREHGENALKKKKQDGIIKRIFSALKEPMLIILLFGFMIALGANIGKFLRTGEGDFLECFGILFAVILSVFINLVMEGSSKRAFDALSKIYDNVAVRVIRMGKIVTISQKDVVVGDILLLDAGDKIVADGRIIESNSLLVDESSLTGESEPITKDAKKVLSHAVPLAERVNFVFSGTFVTNGSAKIVVTAVGDKTEIGNIAKELSTKNERSSPLEHKLSSLGKTVTIIGAICAVSVLIISMIRLALTGDFTFNNVQELFISCIILIVAAVPEGLPTIVAVSLALNMIKLAKENALIKKMTATETAGAVSVICSDKTGTLTQNKMTVKKICTSEFCLIPEKKLGDEMAQNFVCNSSADVKMVKGKYTFIGNSTECALISAFIRSKPKISYESMREKYKIIEREPFSSDKKYMTTTIETGEYKRILIKGAPEKVLPLCELTGGQREKLDVKIKDEQRKAQRVLCFAHYDFTDNLSEIKYVYDGFVSISDPVRKEAIRAVKDCQNAGIKVKMLTGDNKITAYAVALELGMVKDFSEVIDGAEIEKMDEKTLKKTMGKITVVARSTPTVKLKIVRALKEMGEVVAVTGDGINDAPAIKHADVGIAMGINGSEITKEAADVVLLDDSFSAAIKTISFGRNVYKNLQRFILFQLSVNLSALLIVVISAIIGVEAPFNTFQLLWINIIMDGPPALTLGLEKADDRLMRYKPVKRTEKIVNLKMLLRIILNGTFIGVVVVCQYLFNFLGVKVEERLSATFTLFILFQLFNAFNSKELGADSILKGVGKNKVMLITFIGVFILQYVIVQYAYKIFGVYPMSVISWIKTLLTACTIVLASEGYKFAFRVIRKRFIKGMGEKNKNSIKINKKRVGA